MVLLVIASAHAQVDVQRSFGDAGEWWMLREPTLGVPWSPAVGVGWQEARDVAPGLPQVGTGEVTASFVMGRLVRVGATLPHHQGDGVRPGWGDVSSWASFAVSNQDGEGLEGTWTVQYDAATGREPWLTGPGTLQGTMSAGSSLGDDGRFGRWAAQLGLQLHREVELPGTVWQDAWLWGVGYRAPVGLARLGLEAAGRWPARLLRPRPGDVSVEGALVGGAQLHDAVLVQGVVGTALVDGLGAPSLRMGLVLDVRPRGEKDRDGDGVPDVRDRCRTEPEDRDGYQDADGCPDTDNDADGVPDARDACPDRAENDNGIDDDDGCPEAAMWWVLTVETEAPVALVRVQLDEEVWTQPPGEPVAHVVREVPLLPFSVEAEGHVTVSDQLDGLGHTRLQQTVRLRSAAAQVEGERLALPQPVTFAVDAEHVENEAGLDPVLAWLEAHPTRGLVVEGRADGSGEEAYNQDLSERRARWVVDWLVARGVAPERLTAVGLGESAAEGDDQDRRVGFLLR